VRNNPVNPTSPAASSRPSSPRLTQWFADATNGIGEMIARVFKGEQLCLGETCITEPKLQQLLDLRSQSAAAAGAATTEGGSAGAPGGSSAPADTDTASTTPPSDSSGTPPVGTDEAPDTPAEVEPSAGEAGATTSANDNAPAEENEQWMRKRLRNPYQRQSWKHPTTTSRIKNCPQPEASDCLRRQP
jgi:hypothetical protein